MQMQAIFLVLYLRNFRRTKETEEYCLNAKTYAHKKSLLIKPLIFVSDASD